MGNGSELKSPAARALRAAGYKPAPRYWLTQDQMDLLEYMARQNEADVNRIRHAARSGVERTKEQDIERAWRAHRRAD